MTMTRDEALKVLELPPGSPIAEVEARFVEQIAAAWHRESAGGAAQRAEWKARAQLLRQAHDLLLAAAAEAEEQGLTDFGPSLERTPTGVGDGGGRAEASGAAVIRAGQVLGNRYEIRARLGSGGMGEVFAAFDRVRKAEVALKVLLPHLLDDAEARDRFLNEARIASRLSHPSIVRVHDIHEADGLTYLTMELLKGHTLPRRSPAGPRQPSRTPLTRCGRSPGRCAQARARAPRDRALRHQARKHLAGRGRHRQAHRLRHRTAAWPEPVQGARVWYWAQRITWRPSSSTGMGRSTTGPTSMRWVSCFTSCSRARCPWAC